MNKKIILISVIVVVIITLVLVVLKFGSFRIEPKPEKQYLDQQSCIKEEDCSNFDCSGYGIWPYCDLKTSKCVCLKGT